MSNVTTSNTTTVRTISTLLLSLLVSLIFTAGAHAATLSVCASGCAHSSIQGAIDSASDGDVIELAPETFLEGNLLVDVDVTIRASSGQPVVNGNGALTVFKIDADALVVLEDLRLTNASRALVANRGHVWLRTVYATGDGVTNTVYGGIVNHNNASMVLEQASVVAGNRSTNLGGGITNFGTLEVTNSTIIGNQGRLGGGIFNAKGDVVVSASSISANHATVRGGGYANAHVNGGAVIVLPSSSYSSNTATDACDKYYDIHRSPACVN